MESRTLKKDNNTEIKYVYHISDIHIRNNGRHDEYTSVFKNLYQKLRSLIKNRDESLIVLTGDIFHTKNSLSSEAYNMAGYFFKDLQEIAPLIIIAGNHDCNLSNPDRLDSLSSVMNMIFSTGSNSELVNEFDMYYLKKSGSYRFHNIVFGVTDVFESNVIKADAVENLFNKVKQNNKYKIALYHGTIDASRIESNHKLTGRYNAADFNGYDYVMLGDIHKFQYMNNNKTIAYAGSLIQQSFGESVDKHGFLRWNLVDGTSKYYDVHNDFGFCNIEIINGKMVDTYIMAKPRIRFLLKNTTDEDYLKIKNKIETKHNVLQVIKASNFQTVIRNNPDCVYVNKLDNDKSTDGIQLEKIKNYLRDTNTDESLIDAIAHLHESICSKLLKEGKNITGSTKMSKNQTWEILELQFSNLLCFGPGNIIDFQNMEPNQIIGILAANHSGKSSIVDIILYCLFEKFTRGDKNNIVRIPDPESTEAKSVKKLKWHCSLKFKIGNKTYKIMRCGGGDNINNEKHISKVDFCSYVINENEVVTEKNLNGGSKKHTQNNIENIIGDYTDYLNSCVYLQESSKNNNFVDMTTEKKKDYLKKILNIDLFENCDKYANDEITSLKIKKRDLEKEKFSENIVSLQKKLNDLEDILSNAKNEKEKWINLRNIAASSKNILDIKYRDLSKYGINLKTMDNKTISEKFVEEICVLENKIDNDFDKMKQDEYNKIEEIESKIHKSKNLRSELNRKLKRLRKRIYYVPDKLTDIDLLIEQRSQTEKQISACQNIFKKYPGVNPSKINDVIENVCSEIDKLNNSIVSGKQNAPELLKKIINKMRKIDYCSIDEFILTNKSVSDEDKKILSKEVKVAKKYVDYLKTITAKIKLCVDDEIADSTKQTLLEIVDDNTEITKKLEKKIFDKCKLIKTDNHKIQKAKKLKVDLEQAKIDAEIFKNNNEILEKIKILRKKHKDLNYATNICTLKQNFDLLNDQIQEHDTFTDILKENNKINGKIRTIENKLKDEDIKIARLKDNVNVCNKNIQQFNEDIIRKKHIQSELYNLKLYQLEFMSFYFDNESHAFWKNEKKLANDKISFFDKCRINTLIERNSIKQRIKSHKKIEKKFVRVSAKLKIYVKYRTVVGNLGLPLKIMENCFPDITKIVNSVLALMTNFVIDMKCLKMKDNTIIGRKKVGATKDQKVGATKDQKKVGNIEISLQHKDKNSSLMSSASGFEKFATNLAMRITLSQISSTAKPNFFIIDEGWSCMDNNNLADVSNILNYLKEMYEAVIIVSHLDELKNQIDYPLTIENKNNLSYINNTRKLNQRSTKNNCQNIIEV